MSNTVVAPNEAVDLWWRKVGVTACILMEARIRARIALIMEDRIRARIAAR